MVWLLNSQGTKHCKNTESFCLSILFDSINDWSTYMLMFTAAMSIFPGKIPNYV